MAVIEIKNLSKHFDNVKAVNGVDLAIPEGELLVILGPSGCGKTTLMRMIAGLEKPTSGVISIGGLDVTELPPRARPMERRVSTSLAKPKVRARAMVLT